MTFREVTLGEISVGNKGSYGIPASAVEYSEDLYTYLRITDINDDGTLNKDGLKSVDDENANKYLLKPNDIVFARTGGSTGRSYFYDGSDGEFVYAGFLIKFSLDPTKVNPKYFKYYTLSDEYKGWVNSFNTGSTRGNINAQTYANMKLNLPDCDQQKLLVDTLSGMDYKIEINNRINKTLEEMAQAIFKSWFVDFEPFQDAEFEDSDLGKIPKGWRVGRADDFFDIAIGKTPPRKEPQWFSVNKDDVKWVSISDMGNCSLYIFNTSEYLTRDGIEKYNVKIVPAGTVLLSFKLTVGRVVITTEEMTTNEAIAHFKSNKNTINGFLYFYLKNFNYDTLGNTSSIASAVNSKVIKAMTMLMPDDNTLNNYHNIINPLMIEIRKSQEENQTLTAIRDALLPRLMSGEIRVPIVEG
ncbi:MAG TPA: restriction endonuclease subunit S [Clostridium sp.]